MLRGLRALQFPVVGADAVGEMARCARKVVAQTPHHVVARGVDRIALFRSGYDKRRYLRRFAALAAAEGVTVHGYCLMTNHVHWLVTPADEQGLARLFQRLHTSWAMTYNRRYGRTGHLFQNRFHSVPVQASHYWAALRYIEVNPRRAGLTERLAAWEHSSAQAHLEADGADPLVPLLLEAWRHRFTSASWRAFLAETDESNSNPKRQCATLCAPASHRSACGLPGAPPTCRTTSDRAGMLLSLHKHPIEHHLRRTCEFDLLALKKHRFETR